ncbi:DUF2975 domain-containing protein [Gillisia sp. Q332]|uniref:DUF2975 domain-containing protein n=1 Tax=Gillisia xinjiangensis TaxID=3384765 RepID=UPI003919C8C6
MNRNSLLNIANFFCQFFKLSFGVSIIIITIVFLHFQFDRNFYDEWNFEKPGNDSLILIETESFVGEKSLIDEKQKLSGWNTVSLYFNYLKYTAILIFLFLSINQFRRVLKSVRKLETFHQTNVQAFKKIGNYCLLMGGLSVFSYWDFGNHAISSFTISFNILFVALIAFILAEIFKEGNNLMEENELTV